MRKRLCQTYPSPTKRSRILFDTTNLSPPVTPEKNRIVDFDIKHDKSGVRNLFPSPPTTPTKKSQTSVYSEAKALFLRGCSTTGPLVGRDDEAAIIDRFLNFSLKNNLCNSMYISGPPGCGKTAQLDWCLSSINLNNCKVIKINCMILTNPQGIFDCITRSLEDGKDLYETLINGVQGVKLVIVVLDEIDYLLTRDQEILFKLFKMSEKSHSSKFMTKLILIGISNSLDLSQTLLPKLERNQISPKLVSFKPYNFEKMKLIVTEKLKLLVETDKENIQENFIPIINASAILLCCKKVSSSTGDLRKCFDVIYKSIELLESEIANQDYDLINCPKVTISQIAKVCNLNQTNSILSKLTYLQQTIMVYLLKHETGEQEKFTINEFYEYYKNTVLNNKLIKIKKTEFLEILINLESLSIISLSNEKNPGLKYIQSNVNYQDFNRSISSIDTLKNLL